MRLGTDGRPCPVTGDEHRRATSTGSCPEGQDVARPLEGFVARQRGDPVAPGGEPCRVMDGLPLAFGMAEATGDERPPSTTPALAVKTRSGSPGTGSRNSTSAPASRNDVTSPSCWVRATSGSGCTSTCMYGLIS